ncbi:MAG: MarR family transcriptional regulator [Actinomycetota bacterium]|nr:MarR family transcriptional regulator [Actinomycetota bacterium]
MNEPNELPGGGLGYALAAAAHAWRAELADTLADLGVTPSQFFVLASLLHRHSRGREAPTQRRLAEESGMDPNTASQVLRGLERRGIVSRQRRAQDSRSVAITLTIEGLDLARESTTRARALNQDFFSGFDVEALFATLTGLAGRRGV